MANTSGPRHRLYALPSRDQPRGAAERNCKCTPLCKSSNEISRAHRRPPSPEMAIGDRPSPKLAMLAGAGYPASATSAGHRLARKPGHPIRSMAKDFANIGAPVREARTTKAFA